MSTPDQIQRSLDEVRRKRADADKRIADARRTQSTKESSASSYRAKAARATTASSAHSCTRQAESAERDALAAGRKVAEWSGKVADASKKEAELHKALSTALARQSADAERARRRREDTDRRSRDVERRAERARTDAALHAAEGRVSRLVVTLSAPKVERLRILYVTATSEGDLRVEKEMRRVNQGVERATQRHLVEIKHLPAATPSDLLSGMSGFRPHVLHFSGHADRTSLVFDTDGYDANDGHSVDAALFARAVGAFDHPPLLVVLNACESAAHLAGLLAVVPMAIGMSDEIGDPDAMSFAARFYASIADGQSVGSAFRAATVQMELDGMTDADLPVLASQDGVDPYDVRLVVAAE